MATFVFGMNQSLDGYVDHTAFGPGKVLFRHFIEQVRGQAGAVYGRGIYQLMQYWETDDPGWDDDEREFAAVWRATHKWVVSRTLTSVGPNATLVPGDAGDLLRDLRTRIDGEIDVVGPTLAASMTALGLIDLYRIYLHPVVLGRGTPFFAGPRPRLRLLDITRIDEDVVRLTYAP